MCVCVCAERLCVITRVPSANHGRILVRDCFSKLPMNDLYAIGMAIYNDYDRLMLNCFFSSFFHSTSVVCCFNYSRVWQSVYFIFRTNKGEIVGADFSSQQKLFFCFQLINHDLRNECESPHESHRVARWLLYLHCMCMYNFVKKICVYLVLRINFHKARAFA